MKILKLGTKVRVIEDDSDNFKPGDILTIAETDRVYGENMYFFEEDNGDCGLYFYEVEPLTKHKYVLSSSHFDSKEEALEKLREWEEDGTLEEETKVYKVSKIYEVVNELSLEEME